ncbi:MAG: sigma 54-interacting transcriptional regulator [Pseudomonadota bacterium]
MTSPPPSLCPLIFESIGEAVFTVDAQWRIQSFNKAAERLTGARREEVLGRRCHEVFKADICQQGCALRRTIETGEPVRDARVTILDGEMNEVPVSVSTAVLQDPSGAPMGGVEIMRDLSEITRLERRLVQGDVFEEMVGRSPAMQELFALLPDVARADVPVLIEGPSGTGKELVARALHRLSDRARHPFVQVNCGALPDTLLESELFGYRRGAFTGAERDTPGRLAAAQGGTVLLDEIGETSPAFQVKLLRTLQEGEVQPLGAARPEKVDVRILAATNRDLGAMVRLGAFRGDLYYRLRVIHVELPPLARRREDIPLLAAHLLERVARRRGRPVPAFTPAALGALEAWDYPGNVRELENVIERAMVMSRGGAIDLTHLPPEVVHGGGGRVLSLEANLRPGTRSILGAALPEPEQEEHLPPEATKLLEALRLHGWHRERAAEALGISRSTLWRRMKEFGLL